MSKQNRKISYWSIDFLTGEEHSFDSDMFCRFMAYMTQIDKQELLSKDDKQNKAISLDNVKEVTKQGIHLFRVIFKSCKYNHSPNYMSSIDGSERPTDKELTEGDKELTHMCFRIDESEVYTVFEERRNGVSMGGVMAYYNHFFKKFLEASDNTEDNLILQASIVPPDDFLTSLKHTNRISAAELFVEKKVIGSEYLNLMEDDTNAQEDLIITVKAKPRQSLAKRTIENVYNKITTDGTEIGRVRIRGKDANKMSVTIDSLNGKKVDEITVDLLENGVVDSYSLFSKIEELLGVM